MFDKKESLLLMYTTPDGVTKVDVTFKLAPFFRHLGS